MICPKCQTEYEGDTCPNCGKVILEKAPAEEAPEPAAEAAPDASAEQAPDTAEIPEPAAPAEPAAREPVALYVVLAAIGTLVLAVMAASMLIPRLIMEETGVKSDRRSDSSAGTFSLPDDVREQEESRRKERERREKERGSSSEQAVKAEAGVDYYSFNDAPFKVGDTLPPGDYMLIATDYYCDHEYSDSYGDFTYSIYSTYTMTDSRRIGGGWLQNNAYLTVEDGQALDFSFADLWPLDSEKFPVVLDPFEKSGMFIVGKDVDPGTYTVVSNNPEYTGRAYVYDEIPMDDSEILFEEFVSDGEEEEMTLESGQVLVMEFCKLKK